MSKRRTIKDEVDITVAEVRFGLDDTRRMLEEHVPKIKGQIFQSRVKSTLVGAAIVAGGAILHEAGARFLGIVVGVIGTGQMQHHFHEFENEGLRKAYLLPLLKNEKEKFDKAAISNENEQVKEFFLNCHARRYNAYAEELCNWKKYHDPNNPVLPPSFAI